MWRIISGLDSAFSTPQEGSTVYSLEFTDGSILLESVPEVSSGDSEQTSLHQESATQSQCSEFGTQYELPLAVKSTSYSQWG